MTEYAQRRARLIERLGPSGGGIFLAPARPSRSGGGTFRQLDDFLYFTGLELPDSVLVIDADTRETLLFVPEHDTRFVSADRPNDFPGRPLLGDPEIERRAGGAFVRRITDLPALLAEWARDRQLWFNPGWPGPLVRRPLLPVASTVPEENLIEYVRSRHPLARLLNAYPEIAQLRMIKSPKEIEAIWDAVQATAVSIRRAVGALRPGIDERSLQGEFEAGCRINGAQRIPFTPIVKSGPNSLWPWRVLASHYDRRNRRMRAGELVIFDVGCERDYYVADVGRTFPVSGSFTTHQAAILEMELRVADTIIAAVAPGTTLARLQAIGEMAIPAEHRAYMQAGLFFGHHIGLSTGDPSMTETPLRRVRCRESLYSSDGHRPLKPGCRSEMSMPKEPFPRRSLAFVMATTLAAFPVTGTADTYPKKPGIDVLEYVFRVTLSDSTDEIVGVTTADVRFHDEGVAQIELDLIARADVGAEHGMTVDEVWIADWDGAAAAMGPTVGEGEGGAPAAFAHDRDRLRIRLPETSRAGQRLFVTVAYHGQPATGLIIGPNKHGDRTFFSDDWPNKARNWLPTVDHVYDKARSQMVVTAPAHYQVVSNGLVQEETDLGDGTRRTHWRNSVPIAPWLFVLGAAPFAVQHLADFRGKPVQTWVYAQDRDAGFYDFAVPTHDVLRFYEDNIGPYAYEKLANIQSNSVGGGMEAASAILYGDDSVTGNRSVRWRNVVIHEIAHQWFGNAVTEYDWDDVWLSEGFATYFTLLYREHAYGRDDFVEGLRGARGRVLSFYDERPDYRVVHDNLDDMSQVTTGMQYQKGAWVLHMLRRQVGTEIFWEGIRSYYRQHRNGHATTADFRRAMEEVSGQGLDWFFHQWLYQGGVPQLRASWRYVPAAGAVELELIQGPTPPRYRLPIEVELHLHDGSTRRERVELMDDSERFMLAVESAPAGLDLDPDVWLLARVELTPR